MKLTIIGGGGVRTPKLIPALVRRARALDLREVWLQDIDAPKLAIIGELCRAEAERLGATFTIHLTTDAREALTDAAHIITTIRPGFEAGRAIDERICFKHGVLGQETTGAAGFAMAMRSIPAILEYARLAERFAPGAWIYNFTNPAGLVAQALHNSGIARVVGICDSANTAKREAARFLNVPIESVRHAVFGLNHLSWTSSVQIDPDENGRGEEVLQELLSNPRFIRETHMQIFDPELVADTGMFMNEYLHYYYHRDEALRALLIKPETRGEQVYRLNHELLAALRGMADQPLGVRERIYNAVMAERDASYMAHAKPDPVSIHNSHHGAMTDDEGYAGVALDCVVAIARNEPHYTGLNVPNRGAIPALRDDDVVEVSCRIDGSGYTVLPVPPIPQMQFALIHTVKVYERLAVESILTRSKSLAVDALTVHPLIGSYPLAQALVGEFIAAHPDTVGVWG